METVEATVTKVLDVLSYRHFWITRVEIFIEGSYRNINLTTYSERDARAIQQGDTVSVWVG